MSFLAFLAAALILAVTPGPGIAYVVARTVAGGRAEGLASCLGTALGGLLHVLAAALGLSLLVAQSALAFNLLKFVGAAYLVYLGVRMLMSRAPAFDVGPVSPQGARRALVDGIVVEALNVKTALFFLAFLPQFIAPQAGGKGPAFLLLGLIFIINGTLVMLVFAALVARLRRQVAPGGVLARWLARAGGTLFVALGARLALEAPR